MKIGIDSNSSLQQIELKEKINELDPTSNINISWIDNIKSIEKLKSIDKKIIDELIEDIVIDNNGNIKIFFKCQDKYFEALDFINRQYCDIIPTS